MNENTLISISNTSYDELYSITTHEITLEEYNNFKTKVFIILQSTELNFKESNIKWDEEIKNRDHDNVNKKLKLLKIII